MEELLVQIGNYGFPILITVYLLIRMENRIEKLTESITELNNSLMKLK